ncbi:helix-turn-helix transcriptional regulator [Bacillus sp. NEB1478]|nr:helix-turn-helix transcriptional regulator [Bacillus sp. NEB1478]WNB93492.1 helix-turn-helix transcriptional regulator [Bacillus sp. NEB1478]
MVYKIELNKRQQKIVEIVKDHGPITGEHIADQLDLTRATLRPDLAILTMAGYLDARPRVGYFYTGKTGSQLLTEKIKKIKVAEFTSMPVLVQESSTVYEAICTMFLEDVGALYIINKNGHLVGVVSRKDLLRASMGKQEINNIPINIIMTRMPNITYCYKDDFLLDIAHILIDKQIDGLPVVKHSQTGSGLEVVGRITKTNITKALVELAHDEIL